jgi:7,8-dihydro-6-hydroxymethylpterin-pyrophosphokinase
MPVCGLSMAEDSLANAKKEAGVLLSQMLKASASGGEEQKQIRNAIQMRTTLSERTCRLAAGASR